MNKSEVKELFTSLIWELWTVNYSPKCIHSQRIILYKLLCQRIFLRSQCSLIENFTPSTLWNLPKNPKFCFSVKWVRFFWELYILDQYFFNFLKILLISEICIFGTKKFHPQTGIELFTDNYLNNKYKYIYVRTPQLPIVFRTNIFSVFLKYFLDTEKYEVS